MDASISAASLRQSILGAEPPLVIDVRRSARFLEARDLIRGALRRDPERVEQWRKTLPRAARVVVYCVHGHEVSQNVAKALGARYLEGGIEAWREMGGEILEKPKNATAKPAKNNTQTGSVNWIARRSGMYDDGRSLAG